jgi:putative nucleotide binding protein
LRVHTLSRPYFKHRDRHREERRYENAVYILDYLEMGNPHDIHPEHRNKPFVQGVGTKYFTLLEAMPLMAVRIEILERVDLEYPSKLRGIIPITYSDLTAVARTNLPEALRRIITENERVFVEFFNIAEPINIRLHSLRLLPEIGAKTLDTLLDERRRARFTSFSDIKDRIKIDPVKALVNRIITELVGEEKYYLFIKPRDKTAIYLGYLEKLYGEII